MKYTTWVTQMSDEQIAAEMERTRAAIEAAERFARREEDASAKRERSALVALRFLYAHYSLLVVRAGGK